MAAYTFPNTPKGGDNEDNDQVALFIDWDNLVISNYADRGSNRPDLEVLVKRAQQYGTLVIARAYAEWNNTVERLEVYKAGIEPIYAPVFHASNDLSGQTSKGKSLADPVMVTDCIDFLHLLPQVGTYVLVTGDKDMVPVVRLARLRGRRVVIIGPDYVANVLQQVSDEFIPYRFLLAQVVPADPVAAAYYQQGYYAGQMQAGLLPGQAAPPTATGASQAANANARGNRRLTGRRGATTPPAFTPPVQPYAARNMPAMPATPPAMPAPYAQYGQPGYPGMMPPGYQPGVFQMPAATGYAYTPGQAQPATPAPTPTAAQPSSPLASTPTPQAPVAPGATPTLPSAPGGKIVVKDFNDVKEVIRQILAQKTNGGRGQMRARDLKEELVRRIPNFNERQFGFSKFKAMLNAAESAGVLQIDQSGHILWVSVPGTPKMQPETTPDPVAALVAEAELDDELLEGDDEPNMSSALAAFESKIAEAVATEPVRGRAAREREREREREKPATPEMLEATQPEAAIALPAPEQKAKMAVAEETEPEAAVAAPTESRKPETPRPTIIEERTTAIAETPISQERKPTPVKEAAVAAPAQERKAEAPGQMPKLLEQPHYQEVIVLVDDLRKRNRWVGYELLLSNVRDYLTKQMPEAEAKLQAGNILSKLLNDGIIKMQVEVHSRGPRKMTVKVAHLQDTNPAVRYALENRNAKPSETATATPDQEAAPVAEQEVAIAELKAVLPEVTPTVEAAPVQAQAQTDTERAGLANDLAQIESYLRENAATAVHFTRQAKRPSAPVVSQPAPAPVALDNSATEPVDTLESLAVPAQELSEDAPIDILDSKPIPIMSITELEELVERQTQTEGVPTAELETLSAPEPEAQAEVPESFTAPEPIEAKAPEQSEADIATPKPTGKAVAAPVSEVSDTDGESAEVKPRTPRTSSGPKPVVETGIGTEKPEADTLDAARPAVTTAEPKVVSAPEDEEEEPETEGDEGAEQEAAELGEKARKPVRRRRRRPATEKAPASTGNNA
jgi:uncharacterized LabA/DUF88 family protein